MTVGTLAPLPADKPLTENDIRDKLAYWRGHILEAQGPTNSVVTLTEARDQMDIWLERLLPFIDPRDIT